MAACVAQSTVTPLSTTAAPPVAAGTGLPVEVQKVLRQLDANPSMPLTPAERRVLKLLPTSTCRQMAAALYVSPHTVKTHLRGIYHKLGVASRAEALERAVDLRLL